MATAAVIAIRYMSWAMSAAQAYRDVNILRIEQAGQSAIDEGGNLFASHHIAKHL